MWYLTRKQHEALAAFKRAAAEGTPSIQTWANECGYADGSTFYRVFVTSLLAKQLISSEAHKHRTWKLTPLGRKYLTIYDKAAELLE